VYCHSPAKWLYRREDYLGDSPSATVRVGLRALDPVLRRFDRRATASADTYVANSTFIAAQVLAVYGIEAEVLFPPAGFAVFGPREAVPGLEPGYVLTVSRLLPYKKVEQVVDAFRLLPGLTLVVVGDGPERSRLAAGAPENVRFLSEVDDSTLRWLYASCGGLVAASREDFGLTPVEAAVMGKPVAALRFGGYLDTVIEDVTGVFFDVADPAAIAEAVEALVTRNWDADGIRVHAEAFSEQRFVERIRAIVAEVSR
jgi:glycosyltransferase involved in cell wall biosynthesis